MVLRENDGSQRRPTPVTPYAADVYLLTMEVEAAAQRNAELSQRLERATRDLSVLNVSSVAPVELHGLSASTQTTTTADDMEAFSSWREVVVLLDDALYDLSELHFHGFTGLGAGQGEPLTILTRPTVDELARPSAMRALAMRCRDSVAALKTGWKAKQLAYHAFIAELRSSLEDRHLDLEKERRERDAAMVSITGEKRRTEETMRRLFAENEALTAACAELEQRVTAAEADRNQLQEEKAALIQRCAEQQQEIFRVGQERAVAAGSLAQLRQRLMEPFAIRSVTEERRPHLQAQPSPDGSKGQVSTGSPAATLSPTPAPPVYPYSVALMQCSAEELRLRGPVALGQLPSDTEDWLESTVDFWLKRMALPTASSPPTYVEESHPSVAKETRKRNE